MPVKSGAGAAVSSGASYQARVGAYVIATSICGVESEMVPINNIDRLSFETAEDVDDINITMKGGVAVYIQAKAIISYSTGKEGEIRSVLRQFEAQCGGEDDMLILSTTSRSSKKVVFDLRAALEAFRTGPEKEFFRDQPRALTTIISELREVICTLQLERAIPVSSQIADEIIRRMSVVILDVEVSDPLEQATILLLESRHFAAAPAVWGKLVSDCVGYARTRQTVQISDLKRRYSRFCNAEDRPTAEASVGLLTVELQGLGFSAGRDLLLCVVPQDADPLPTGYAIIETYRFDEDCRERLHYEEDTVEFSNGIKVPLLRRAATYEGMERHLKRYPNLVGENELTICPINSDEDFETSGCAEIHRARLQTLAENGAKRLSCVHCGSPVFSAAASVVELPPIEDPVVGLSHDSCLRPADRIIGSIQSDLFESHPELVNFDANGWFKAAHGGQIAFSNAEFIASGQGTIPMIWGGDEPKGPIGSFVVEVALQGGGREIVTKRNDVHRFARGEAEAFATRLNQQFAAARENGDPFCYTDESKSFSIRSELIRRIGAKERITPVDHARARPYDQRFAARYSRPGQWYTPLLYLKDRETGDPVMERDTVLMITDPTRLASFLENWREAGISIPEYETSSVLTDAEFDDFMRWVEERDFAVIVDPMLDPAKKELLSGYPIQSLDFFMSRTDR